MSTSPTTFNYQTYTTATAAGAGVASSPSPAAPGLGGGGVASAAPTSTNAAFPGSNGTMMMPSSSSSQQQQQQQQRWEQLRSEARTLEQTADRLISQMESIVATAENRVVSATTTSSSSGGGINHTNHANNSNNSSKSIAAAWEDVSTMFRTAQSALERELGRLTSVTADMNAALAAASNTYNNNNSSASSSSSSLQTYRMWTERYQAVLLEKQRALSRLQQQFRARREKMELTYPLLVAAGAGAGKGSSSYNNRNHTGGGGFAEHDGDGEATGGGNGPDAFGNRSEGDGGEGIRMLMEERNSITHTHRNVSRILDNAAATHARLRQQRERFTSMQDRLVGLAERIPVIGEVLRRIDSRRRRDVVVLGLVFAICLFFVVIFW